MEKHKYRFFITAIITKDIIRFRQKNCKRKAESRRPGKMCLPGGGLLLTAPAPRASPESSASEKAFSYQKCEAVQRPFSSPDHRPDEKFIRCRIKRGSEPHNHLK